MNLDLPFADASPAELEEYLKEIDRALDAGFLTDLEHALQAAAEARALLEGLPSLAG